jgi:hypothetical protein
MAWSPAGRLLVAGGDGRTLVDRPGQVTPPMAPFPVDVAWLDDSRVAVVDAVAGVVFAGSGVVDAAYLPGARIARLLDDVLAVAGDDVVALFDGHEAVPTPRLVATGVGQTRAVTPLGPGRWAVGGDGGLAVVHTAAGSAQATAGPETVRQLAWRPGMERVAAVDARRQLHLVDVCNGVAASFEALPFPVDHVAIIDRTSELLAASGAVLRRWRIDPSGQAVAGPQAKVEHQAPITALAVSVDGVVAAGDAEGTVHLWSPQVIDHPVASLTLSTLVSSVVWSPDGRQLAISADDGAVAVVDVTPGLIA